MRRHLLNVRDDLRERKRPPTDARTGKQRFDARLAKALAGVENVAAGIDAELMARQEAYEVFDNEWPK